MSQFETDLIERARAGGRAAFDELLSPHLPAGISFAFSILRNFADAEDAVQDASLKAWLGLHTFRLGRDFKPWFLTIVGNQCRTMRRNPWLRVHKVDQAQLAHLPDESTAQEETMRYAMDAVLCLDPSERAVLFCQLWLDLPPVEVARVMGISQPAATSRYYRALRRARAVLDGPGLPNRVKKSQSPTGPYRPWTTEQVDFRGQSA